MPIFPDLFSSAPAVLRPATLLLLLTLGGRTAHAQHLSLTLQEAPLTEAFRLVEARTPLRFVYAREDLSGVHSVTLRVEAAPLDSVLSLLFHSQPLTYRRVDSFIIVRPDPRALLSAGGWVVDEEGLPVGGASVQVEGSTVGTVADSSGAFVLRATAPQRLRITAVGYEEAAAVLRHGRTTITLRRTTPVIDETIVVGYGRTTRRKATGSVGKVSGRALATAPSAIAPLTALQGRVTGLFLRPASGLPDAPLTVRIRGQHSLQAGSAPLYLIDGVPVHLEGTALSGRSPLAALAPIDPLAGAEIASIEVLRDADATAIYGSRGSGGVILVTTHAAGEGHEGLEVTLGHGWQWAGRTADYLSTPRYRQLRREAFQNDGLLPTTGSAPDLTVWDSTRDQRWQQRLIGGSAPTLKAEVRWRGGSGRSTYGLSGSYGREGSVFPGDFFSGRSSLRASAAHHTAGGKLHLEGSAALSTVSYRLPAQDLSVFSALPPNMYPPYDARGRLVWEEGGARMGNPMAAVHQPFSATLQQLSASGRLRYRPAEPLELEVLWGGHRLQFSEELRYPIAAQDPARHPRGSVTRGSKSAYAFTWEPQARYRFALGGRTPVVLLTGATLQDSRWAGELLTAGGYTDDALLGALSYAATLSARSEASRYRYAGWYGRISGEHREKYLLQATLRRDGSSRFGPGRQFALFGAVGAGWIFTREAAVRRVLPALSYGKLRTSYGATGNDRIGEDAFRERWTLLPYPYAGEAAWRADRLFNPGFGWEVTRKWEAALELGWLQERLLLTLARYQHRSTGLILRTPLPAQTGFTSVLANYPAVVDNRGWEGEVSLRPPVRARLQWSATIQLTVPRNRLRAFAGLEGSPYAATYQMGRPVDNFRGFAFLGVDVQSGLYRFLDSDASGMLNGEDRAYTGTRDPQWYGSAGGTLRRRGWSLSLLLFYCRQQGLHPVYSTGVAPGDRVNMLREVEDRWPHNRVDPAYQRATQDVLGEAYYPSTTRMALSSAALTDASFLTLGQLQLACGGKGPRRGAARWQWQWFLAGHNLATLTRYAGDPEVQSTSTLPVLRTVETGITLSF